MSTAATSRSGAAPASKSGAKAVARVEVDPAVMVMAGILGVCFVALFWIFLAKQYGPTGFSIGYPEDWGHSYIVPFISGYYVWKHRVALSRIERTVFWPGLLLVVVGIVSYTNFIIGYSNHMFQGVSMLVALSGLVLLMLGPKVFGALAMPIGYLAFLVTISERVMIEITFRLQLLAAQGSWVLLNMCGIDTNIQGNTLEVFKASTGEVLPLNVAQACAGMRMVIAFIALSAAVALFSVDRWWKRVAVILLSVPVAVLMNVVRVAVLGFLSLYDEKLAQGDAHTLIGTILLVPAFVLFMGCVWALNKIEQTEAKPA